MNHATFFAKLFSQNRGQNRLAGIVINFANFLHVKFDK